MNEAETKCKAAKSASIGEQASNLLSDEGDVGRLGREDYKDGVTEVLCIPFVISVFDLDRRLAPPTTWKITVSCSITLPTRGSSVTEYLALQGGPC
ncbi:hypothetical protein QL285_008085 [Trifolium repens]|nr:hypothetical protein QL285_008085 [Trifolium repens]